MDNKIQVVVQHFHGCPNSANMLDIVKDAVREFEGEVEFSEQIIDTPELARKYRFRGSPTLLIQGEDFEGMAAPENPDLSCRIYPQGLPDVAAIRQTIQQYIDQ